MAVYDEELGAHADEKYASIGGRARRIFPKRWKVIDETKALAN